MTICAKSISEPVIGQVETKAVLENPKRSYVALSSTTDGVPEWVVTLGASIREPARSDTNMLVEARDPREVAAMLNAHADALGLDTESETP